jgi:hypothetical protein
MTATLDGVTRKTKPEPTAEERATEEMVRLAHEHGLSLTGPDGLLKQLTKAVLETALNQELTEYLGHAKHGPVGAGERERPQWHPAEDGADGEHGPGSDRCSAGPGGDVRASDCAEAEAAVDRLVADLHRRVVGIQHFQPPAGLLGRVPPVQHLLHLAAQRGVLRQPGDLGPALPLPGQPVRPLGLVPAATRHRVAGQLPADRRRAAAQPRRALSHRAAGLAQPGQLIPLLTIQVTGTVGHSWGRYTPPIL